MTRRAFVGFLCALTALPGVAVIGTAGIAEAVPSSELVEAAEQLAFGAPRFMQDIYAGVYGTPNRVTLAVTDASDPRVEWVESRFPFSGQFDVVAADHTLDELAALTDRIDAESADLLALGIDLAAWGPDLASNRVEIQVEGLEFWEAAELVGRYGMDSVNVVEGVRPTLARCDSRENCPTLRAGLEIELPDWDGACTSGYQARLAAADVSVMLTAGHCAPGSGAALHRLLPVGPVVRNAFEPVPSVATWDTASQVPVYRTNVDALAVLQIEAAGQQVQQPLVTYPWLHSASIYMNDANKERPVGSVFPGGYAENISQVCSLGATAPEDCGPVIHVGWSFLSWGTVADPQTEVLEAPLLGYIQLEDQVAAATCAVVGDSGGPVYFPGGSSVPAVAHGMISSILPCSSSNELTTFTPLTRVQSTLGVLVRTQ